MSKLKVLHVLYQSLPTISGSTIRSRDIIDSQKNHRLLEPVVLTSPFQLSNVKVEMINEINHYRFRSSKNEVASEVVRKNPIILLLKLFRIFSFTKKIIFVAKKEKVDVIHAHAMFFCALSAKLASLIIRKPVIYEVRSLWEERGKKQRPLLTKIFVFLENLSMRVVDGVVSINESLKRTLLERSGLKKNIVVVPNAVNFNLIPHSHNYKVQQPGTLVFGYIGTLSPIEGLDLLVEAINGLKQKGIVITVKFFGSGINSNILKGLKNRFKLDNVHFMGEISPLSIFEAYNQVDVIVNPRKKSKLTDMVTPLKPLEALAYQKLLIISDVGGMSELISEKNIAFTFKAGDQNSLEEVLISVIESTEEERSERKSNGYNYVKTNKNWSENATKYYEIYLNVVT